MLFISKDEIAYEETIAETVAIRLLNHFNIKMNNEVYKHHRLILEYFNTTRNIDTDVDKAFDYILNTWLIGFQFDKQKVA